MGEPRRSAVAPAVGAPGPGPQVGSAALDDLEKTTEEIERHLRGRIAGDSFPLPAMPRAVVQCLELSGAADARFDRIARVLETDLSLSARVVRVANSPRFASLERASNVLQAVTRLGLRELRIVLTEAAVRPLFDSANARIADACRAIWTHSRAVAIVARELALTAGAGDPSDAYLAGLLHDVGKPLVAGFLLEMERAMLGQRISVWMKLPDWISIVHRIHRPIGLALGMRWSLPVAVLQAIEGSSDYRRNSQKSLSNCVRLANQWAKGKGIYIGPMDPDEVKLLTLEGTSLLGLDPAQVDAAGAGVEAALAQE
jgi:HD-like signal output (HDOD) protein